MKSPIKSYRSLTFVQVAEDTFVARTAITCVEWDDVEGKLKITAGTRGFSVPKAYQKDVLAALNFNEK